MLTEPDIEIDVLPPVRVVVNKPFLAQVRSSTPGIEGSAHCDYRIVTQLRNQREKSAFVFNFFVRPDKRHMYKSGTRFNRQIRSPSPMLPPLQTTCKALLSYLGTEALNEHRFSRHYQKKMHIYFRNVETTIILHTVQ